MFTGRRPTDEMFRDDFNLHKFAKTALSEQAVIRILDPTLLLTNHVRGEIEDEATTNFENLDHNYVADKMQECITSVLKIGVQCSAESPRERMDMSDVVRELIKIKEISLETGVH
nr:TPA_asm: hypothetical protein HUJ06_025851 [Nelumbo nucifera]